ncbi:MULTISPECIES: hypothetical protein [Thalassospira]|uniref:Uncharacterized protein n=2 Tax=Thalassospira TaxID=168934 RepID=A0A367W3X4_9PROT|nr:MULTISPECIES: hypothetical protein [Thalassospira]MDG4720737.1 hypothetical protein [Thalassospira sp. FZY0004]RCK35063.1 hypothetical protein TH19_15220 [Thalassospira profundimaris]
MIIFSKSSEKIQPVLPAPETAAWFNKWRFGIDIEDDRNFGFKDENVFTCPTCKRVVPTAFAQADHIFPQKALNIVLGDVTYAGFKKFSDLAFDANLNTEIYDQQAKKKRMLNFTSLRLPIYSSVTVLDCNNWNGGYAEIKAIAKDSNIVKNALTLDIKDIRYQDEDDDAVDAYGNGNYLYYLELAKYDATNLVFLCSLCNEAKSERLFPAHKNFVKTINQQRIIGRIPRYKFLDDNIGPTYCEQRDMT